MKNENQSNTRRDAILDDALREFGRFGYKKTSMLDIAAASGLSKQGLYLHFTGKDAIFLAAMDKYLSDTLKSVRAVLNQTGTMTNVRLASALDAWFGRHLVTFTPEAFDVIGAGDRLSPDKVEKAQAEFKHALVETLIEAGFDKSSANDRAEVLYLTGLSWKVRGTTPENFRTIIETCVRVCGVDETRKKPL